MEIQINNITFNFHYQSHDALGDDENIGLADLIIPGPMARRFARECEWSHDPIDSTFKGHWRLPHYDKDDMENWGYSEHACYNSDTQIVLMNWLFGKRRKYELDFFGLDPYWLFHDSCHAESDVYGAEVYGITSYTEHQRLLEGAEFAYSKGIFMQVDTLIKLKNQWKGRWKWSEGTSLTPFNPYEFLRFVPEEEQEEYECKLEIY